MQPPAQQKPPPSFVSQFSEAPSALAPPPVIAQQITINVAAGATLHLVVTQPLATDDQPSR